MSFWTSFHYYRPTQPPVVTAVELLEFVLGFRDCAVIDEQETYGWEMQVKYGKSIDQDDLPTTRYEPIEDLHKPTLWGWVRRLLGSDRREESAVMLCTTGEIDWDRDEHYEELADLVEGIRGLDSQKKIYRAHIGLGTATKVLIHSVERLDSPENEIDLQLTDWSLTIEPVEISLLASDDVYCVGWISLAIGGYGYLFPWTFRDLVGRAEASPELSSVAKLCRDAWPVATAPPDATRLEHRRILGELWPYPIDAPVDWAWGVLESG